MSDVKYVLVMTTYSPQREMVVELYLKKDPMILVETTLLSAARIFDTFDEAADFLEDENLTHHKIVLIKKKKLFEAKLKGT